MDLKVWTYRATPQNREANRPPAPPPARCGIECDIHSLGTLWLTVPCQLICTPCVGYLYLADELEAARRRAVAVVTAANTKMVTAPSTHYFHALQQPFSKTEIKHRNYFKTAKTHFENSACGFGAKASISSLGRKIWTAIREQKRQRSMTLKLSSNQTHLT